MGGNSFSGDVFIEEKKIGMISEATKTYVTMYYQ